MQNELPEWAVTVARETVVGTMAQASPLFIERVAQALVAAERRGIEKAAKVADKREVMAGKVSHPVAVALLQALPLAIRQLGGEG